MNARADDIEHPTHKLVSALQDAVTEINRQLADWRSRHEDEADVLDASQSCDESLRRKILQFEQEKRQWQTELAAEQERLEEKAQQLTEAWFRLEAEQLALASRPTESPRINSPPARREEPDPTPCAGAAGQGSQEQVSVQPVGGDLECDTARPQNFSGSPVSRPPGIIPREVALRQFARLRSELIPTERNERRS